MKHVLVISLLLITFLAATRAAVTLKSTVDARLASYYLAVCK